MGNSVKVVINPKEATAICNKALYAEAIERGLVAGTITNEYWFVNCKRKGIVFKGKLNDDTKLEEAKVSTDKGSGESKHVPKGEEK